MSFDLQMILESKAAHRRKLAQLSIGEKLRLLDAMRERAIAIRDSKMEPTKFTRVAEEKAEYPSRKSPDKS